MTRADTAFGLALSSLPALAHHGIVGVGVAGLKSPGAPVESAASTVLSEGQEKYHLIFSASPLF